MRVLVIGGTRFFGRRVVERLYERGDQVLLVHRSHSEPAPWVPVSHLYADRHDLAHHRQTLIDFAAEAVLDTCAMTATDVDAALPFLPEVPTVVLSSQDVYRAHAALLAGRCDAPVPLTEDSELRRERYPYRGLNLPEVPDDYSKRDVEDRWLARGAVVLRLLLVYGPHDRQHREDIVLRRVLAGRTEIPIGAGNLLWTRGHVDNLATGVIAALDHRAADGLAVNLGQPQTLPIRAWLQQILDAAESSTELVTVPDTVLPADLALTAAPAQHLLVSVSRAQVLLGWRPADSLERVTESVRWHLENPAANAPWTDEDAALDDTALRAASSTT